VRKTVLARLAAWEERASRRLALPEDSRWRWMLALGAHLGDGILWAVIGGACIVVGTRYIRALASFIGLAVLATATIATVVKYLVRRRRPQELARFYAIRYDRYSFPSGHAVRMATIAVILGHFRPAWAGVVCLLALTVAVCRVSVGVHYPSDVLAGLVLGGVGAWGILLAL
jgi:undecaprenyl-diphosphatase